MDAGKEIQFEERREQRASDVEIQFIDEGFHHFNVLAVKDEVDKKNPELVKTKKGEKKHLGAIWSQDPSIKDFCTCESFYFGNSDEYKKSHTAAFQCKHLIKAREIRYSNYPGDRRL